jgi:hypothetical protein
MMSDFEVSLGEAASPNDFYVKLLGPASSMLLCDVTSEVMV